MPEVDYSQFLYRKPVPPEEEPPRRREKRERRAEKKDRSRVKRALVVVLCVLLCFSLTFCLVDFFSGGKIVKSVYSLMVKPQYAYYLVACSFPTREMAHAGVLAAENAGGAGYLVKEDSYLVFYDVYFDRASADVVSGRNANFFTYEVSFSSSDTDLCNALDAFLRDVSACLNGFDAGTQGESALFDVLSARRADLATIERTEDAKKNLLAFALSRIDALGSSFSGRTATLHKTRNALCAVLFAERDAFS